MKSIRGQQNPLIDFRRGMNYGYTYDSKNQFVAAENDSVKWEYAYNTRGNITLKSEYSVSLDVNNEKVYTLVDTDTFGYTDTVWPDRLTSFNSQQIEYESTGDNKTSGNPTSYKGNTLTWTMGWQLASYGNISYTYNEDGIRTSKATNNVTTRYYLDGTNVIAQTDGTNSIFFRYDSNDEIIGLRYSGADYFYVKNQMGDITGIVDASGNLVAEYEYDPWGSIISVTGSNTALANANPFRYRSYYYDTDTGMYYLQSRYYDPEICRFINADDANYFEVNNNAFTYCENNSINEADASGTATASFVGFGIQIELSFGILSGGLEVVWYSSKQVNVNGRNRVIPYFYAYGGGGIGTDTRTRSILLRIIQKPSLLTNPSSLAKGFGLSVCIFAIWGYSSFRFPTNYTKSFRQISGVIWHVKAYTSWSNTCFVVGAGWNSSVSVSVSYGFSYYWLISLNAPGISNLFSRVKLAAQRIKRKY